MGGLDLAIATTAFVVGEVVAGGLDSVRVGKIHDVAGVTSTASPKHSPQSGKLSAVTTMVPSGSGKGRQAGTWTGLRPTVPPSGRASSSSPAEVWRCLLGGVRGGGFSCWRSRASISSSHFSSSASRSAKRFWRSSMSSTSSAFEASFGVTFSAGRGRSNLGFSQNSVARGVNKYRLNRSPKTDVVGLPGDVIGEKGMVAPLSALFISIGEGHTRLAGCQSDSLSKR